VNKIKTTLAAMVMERLPVTDVRSPPDSIRGADHLNIESWSEEEST
jgi:hypothetical protein